MTSDAQSEIVGASRSILRPLTTYCGRSRLRSWTPQLGGSADLRGSPANRPLRKLPRVSLAQDSVIRSRAPNVYDHPLARGAKGVSGSSHVGGMLPVPSLPLLGEAALGKGDLIEYNRKGHRSRDFSSAASTPSNSFRRIATRYVRTARAFLSMLFMAQQGSGSKPSTWPIIHCYCVM